MVGAAAALLAIAMIAHTPLQPAVTRNKDNFLSHEALDVIFIEFRSLGWQHQHCSSLTMFTHTPLLLACLGTKGILD